MYICVYVYIYICICIYIYIYVCIYIEYIGTYITSPHPVDRWIRSVLGSVLATTSSSPRTRPGWLCPAWAPSPSAWPCAR